MISPRVSFFHRGGPSAHWGGEGAEPPLPPVVYATEFSLNGSTVIYFGVCLNIQLCTASHYEDYQVGKSF